MPRFPRYGFPFQHYRSYFPSNYSYNYTHPTPPPAPIIAEESPSISLSPTKSSDPVWFDLFGIKLYFDDVLILSLLFFLYKEEVKDEGLFLALVLLLIS